MNKGFVIKGDLCHSKDERTLECVQNGYLVCEEGRSAGIYARLPERYAGLPLADYTGRLVIPGLTDLHVHAPQHAYRGLGMDLELLDWLNTRIFPQEARYADAEYARKAYTNFVGDVLRGPNTRACIFASAHVPATLELMDLLEETGLVTMVGKVNMDRNSHELLQERSAEQSLQDTRDWLKRCGEYRNTTPILTPRFVPSCSDELMRGLGELQREQGLPVQSHLSENRGEIDWVAELCPEAAFYGDAYHRDGLFGGQGVPTIMAHCVWSGEEELERMRENGVTVAHCPQSNINLTSGIAPVRAMLERGIKVGLGSDVAGGCHTSILRAMADAIQVSKLRWRLVDQSLPALTVAEAFYLGTVGGGSFFGQVGSFAPGYEFDAVVLDDRPLAPPDSLGIPERLERAIYLSDDRHVEAKYVRGGLVL